VVVVWWKVNQEFVGELLPQRETVMGRQQGPVGSAGMIGLPGSLRIGCDGCEFAAKGSEGRQY